MLLPTALLSCVAHFWDVSMHTDMQVPMLLLTAVGSNPTGCKGVLHKPRESIKLTLSKMMSCSKQQQSWAGFSCETHCLPFHFHLTLLLTVRRVLLAFLPWLQRLAGRALLPVLPA